MLYFDKLINELIYLSIMKLLLILSALLFSFVFTVAAQDFDPAFDEVQQVCSQKYQRLRQLKSDEQRLNSQCSDKNQKACDDLERTKRFIRYIKQDIQVLDC